MALEDKIADLLKPLSKKAKIAFAISCVERVIKLYKLFDQAEDISKADPSIPKGEAYNTLLSIFNFIKEDLELSNPEEIEKQIDECEPLIVDYDIFDTTTINTVAQLISESVRHILDYSLNNDDEKIFYCTENNLEIINQIKSDEYRSKINSDASKKEVNTFLAPIFEHEIEVEEKIIGYIKNKIDNDILQEFIQKNKIEFNL